jgi:hypothetical protein
VGVVDGNYRVKIHIHSIRLKGRTIRKVMGVGQNQKKKLFPEKN